MISWPRFLRTANGFRHVKTSTRIQCTRNKLNSINRPTSTSCSKFNFSNFKKSSFLFGAIASGSSKAAMDKSESLKGVLKEADQLFTDGKFEELYDFLMDQDDWDTSEELLWRVARCEYQLASSAKDQKEKHDELVNSAYEHVKMSLEINDKNGHAHKWASILLDAAAAIKGVKERVLQVHNVREHIEKACEYEPTDATSFFLLGEWHWACYQVSWLERKIASVAFGKLPDADVEVALQMFEKAEALDKDFYSLNKVRLAAVLLELKRDKERAMQMLNEVIEKYSNSEKWDDKDAVEQAVKLLNQNK